jgi:hypothetical protein
MEISIVLQRGEKWLKVPVQGDETYTILDYANFLKYKVSICKEAQPCTGIP